MHEQLGRVYDRIAKKTTWVTYEVQGSGFKVWSKGTPRTGEIGLRYVRPQPGQDGPPPPSP